MIFQLFVTLRLWLNMVIMLMSLILFHLITHILLILSHHQDETHVIRYVQREKRDCATCYCSYSCYRVCIYKLNFTIVVFLWKKT